MRPRHRLQLPRYGMHALGLPIATGHAGHPAARRTPPNVHPPRTRRARRQRQGKARQGKARQGRGRTFAFLRRAAPPSAMPHAPASSLPLTACVGSTGDPPLRRRLSSPSPSASASAAASLRNRSSAVSSFLGLAAAPPPVRSPGADVAGVGPVPVQMWQGWAQSRCRCGRGGPTSVGLLLCRRPLLFLLLREKPCRVLSSSLKYPLHGPHVLPG